MFRVPLIVLVMTGMLFCIDVFAQESPAKGRISKEREAASVRSLEKQPKKEDRAEPSVKSDGLSIEIQTQDVMQYLLENRGKISLFSGMNGKVQLELGLFGYLGLKYQF